MPQARYDLRRIFDRIMRISSLGKSLDTILIQGAKTHNLKNVSLSLPRDKLIVITGLSGSGKSSLAFDTLYAEGQRRYVESLSAYARQFLSMMDKPEVDHIEGLSPAISIEQKVTSHNPRSTVGTTTEIYDYLRLLFARAGTPRCPEHKLDLDAQTISQMVDQILTLEESTKLLLLAPVVEARKGEHVHVIDNLKALGFVRVRIDNLIYEMEELPKLDARKKHTIEAVVDRFKVKKGEIELRLAESFEMALKLGNGIAKVAYMEGKKKDIIFSDKFSCTECGYAIPELEPRLFSFNNPMGACPSCDGLGVDQYFDEEKILVDPKLSLAGGAIRGWDKRNLYYFSLVNSVAEHYEVDVTAPYESLPKKFREKLLYGTGNEDIDFRIMTPRGRFQNRTNPFEGVIPNMQRRYQDTDSQTVRDELAKCLSTKPCETCLGKRLRIEAQNVFVGKRTLPEITSMPIHDALQYFEKLKLKGYKQEIADKISAEIKARLQFLVNVGLDYLSLSRSADTLSGGETQRIRLASQIGSGLVGVMYILDEPSIGLHQRDNDRLLKTLIELRDLGNTVIVVEHDKDAILAADHVVDIGPGAGVHGGEVVAEGTPQQVARNPKSLTGQYLSNKRSIEIPKSRYALNPKEVIHLQKASSHNLKNVSIKLPIGLFTCITGVSGSGKSTLINDTLLPLASRELNGSMLARPGAYDEISGLEYLDKVIAIDQSPIGRTPRSNPATYTGLFTIIRDLFTNTQEARSRGYKAGRFSFNVKGGRCESCQGDGLIKVAMHFLPDVYVKCDVCHGKRYNRETLDILYKGKSIHDVLEMTIEDGLEFFKHIPMLERRLQTLKDVGLDYIKLGQSATTLSGGEAQRMKLARELAKRDTGSTLYILDEPTTGLHFHDVKQLLEVLFRLRAQGNTIVVIEHNLDVIKTADWIIDLGPEGGAKGGNIVATGTPEAVANQKGSYTGQFLKAVLEEELELTA